MRTTNPRPSSPAAGAGTHPGGPAGRRPAAGGGTRRSGRRPVRDLAADFARVYLEVECGRRAAAQAGPLLDRRLAAQLEQVWVRPGPPGILLAVTGGRTAPDAYEAVAVVRRGPRVGAIALRLVLRGGRWRVVEASRPEDGPLPEPPFPIPDEEADIDGAGQAPDRPAGISVGAERSPRLA